MSFLLCSILIYITKEMKSTTQSLLLYFVMLSNCHARLYTLSSSLTSPVLNTSLTSQDTLCCPTSWSIDNILSTKHIAVEILSPSIPVVISGWSDDDIQTAIDEILFLFSPLLSSSSPPSTSLRQYFDVLLPRGVGIHSPFGNTCVAISAMKPVKYVAYCRLVDNTPFASVILLIAVLLLIYSYSLSSSSSTAIDTIIFSLAHVFFPFLPLLLRITTKKRLYVIITCCYVMVCLGLLSQYVPTPTSNSIRILLYQLLCTYKYTIYTVLVVSLLFSYSMRSSVLFAPAIARHVAGVGGFVLLLLTTSSTILSLGIAVGAIVVIAIGKIIKHYTRVTTKICEQDRTSSVSGAPARTAVAAPTPVPMKSTASTCSATPQTPLRTSVSVPATPFVTTPIADDLDALYDSDDSSHTDEKGGSSTPATPVVATNNTTPSISPKTAPITPAVSATLTPPSSSVRGVINDWENKSKSPTQSTPSPSATSDNKGSTSKGRVKQVAAKFEKKKTK